MRLNEKTAIVTGAGGGIGDAVCRAFAAEDASLVCADINAEALNNTVSGIRDAGGRAIGVAGDASEEACATQLVETAKGV